METSKINIKQIVVVKRAEAINKSDVEESFMLITEQVKEGAIRSNQNLSSTHGYVLKDKKHPNMFPKNCAARQIRPFIRSRIHVKENDHCYSMKNNPKMDKLGSKYFLLYPVSKLSNNLQAKGAKDLNNKNNNNEFHSAPEKHNLKSTGIISKYNSNNNDYKQLPLIREENKNNKCQSFKANILDYKVNKCNSIKNIKLKPFIKKCETKTSNEILSRNKNSIISLNNQYKFKKLYLKKNEPKHTRIQKASKKTVQVSKNNNSLYLTQHYGTPHEGPVSCISNKRQEKGILPKEGLKDDGKEASQSTQHQIVLFSDTEQIQTKEQDLQTELIVDKQSLSKDVIVIEDTDSEMDGEEVENSENCDIPNSHSIKNFNHNQESLGKQERIHRLLKMIKVVKDKIQSEKGENDLLEIFEESEEMLLDMLLLLNQRVLPMQLASRTNFPYSESGLKKIESHINLLAAPLLKRIVHF